jgi:hypothetical protein
MADEPPSKGNGRNGRLKIDLPFDDAIKGPRSK